MFSYAYYRECNIAIYTSFSMLLGISAHTDGLKISFIDYHQRKMDAN